MNTLIKTVALRLALVTGLLAALAVPAGAQTAETGSYGYLRVVEGSATLTPEGGERAAAEMNQPVLAGDHLFVPDRSHVEIVLADHNLLRIDGGSELVVERQAGETGRDDQATVIRLIEGNVQLAVVQDSLGDQLPRIDTPNSTLYIKNYGVYRITTESDGYSQILVRRGSAEVDTDQDRQTVRAGEQAGVESGDGQQAGYRHPAGRSCRFVGALGATARRRGRRGRSRPSIPALSTTTWAIRRRRSPATAPGSRSRAIATGGRGSKPAGAPTGTAAGPTRRPG